MRVLVIDDDRAARTILSTNLRAEGFDVRSVGEPSDAIGALTNQSWKPDVLVLDYMMPGLSGGDVIDAMRELPGLHQAPVIIVSSSDEIPERVRREVRAVFRKPVDLAALLDAIRLAAPDSVAP